MPQKEKNPFTHPLFWLGLAVASVVLATLGVVSDAHGQTLSRPYRDAEDMFKCLVPAGQAIQKPNAVILPGRQQ